jgi:predicted RNase H-like HicB family nuclease
MKQGSMKRTKSGRQALVAYLCRFRPEPEGGFTVTCPKLPPAVTYGETLEEAQANAREAIDLCLEVMREDGQPIPPPDRDLASPIDQPVPIADADASERCQRSRAASSSQHWSGPALR